MKRGGKGKKNKSLTSTCISCTHRHSPTKKVEESMDHGDGLMNVCV